MEAGLRRAVERAVGRRPAALAPAGGGDVCRAYRVTLEDGTPLFVKTPRDPHPGMMDAEGRGLRWLAEAEALRVPAVAGVAEAQDGAPAVLALEWIEPAPPRRDLDARLGRGLAALHRAGAPCFGLDADNWIGPLPQPNAPLPSWAAFYGERRLLPMARRARDAGGLGADAVHDVEALVARLPELVGPEEPPARLHGDLWSGNRMTDAAGDPCLVDPAAYGGHREVDLAMMRLFGGFPERCFAAYAEAFPLEPGHAARIALYQLYPLLVHVTLFGGGYRASLEAALRRASAG